MQAFFAAANERGRDIPCGLRAAPPEIRTPKGRHSTAGTYRTALPPPRGKALLNMNNTKKRIFTGAATALVTPFSEGALDLDAFGRIIDYQIAGGISALVVAGTTGEAPALTYEEHAALFDFAVRRSAGRIPVIAGCGSNCTQNSLKLARLAAAAGADALLAVTPYYNKATPDGLYAHYSAIADATPLPLILYNVPSRTGVNITPELCVKLSAHPNIAALKEASGNISACAAILAGCGDSLALYSGNDDMIVPLLSLGGAGVISVLSNLLPAEVSALCRAYAEGRVAEAASLQLKYMDLIAALFAQVNPVPVKCAMAKLGLCREEYRLPLCSPNEKERAVLYSALKKYGL